MVTTRKAAKAPPGPKKGKRPSKKDVWTAKLAAVALAPEKRRQAILDLFDWWSKTTGQLDQIYQDLRMIRREASDNESPLYPLFIYAELQDLENQAADTCSAMASSYPLVPVEKPGEVEQILERIKS